MGSEVYDHGAKQTTSTGNEMKCNQCGRYVDTACKRSDCGVNETATAAETRRVHRKERATLERSIATRDFSANYARVAEWSEKLGYQRPQDRKLLESWAAASNEGKIAVLAIARTL